MTTNAQPGIDMWISIGSTYTYFAVMRADQVAASPDVELRWQIFNVRDAVQLMSKGYRPFTGKPMKLAYMWRDMERRSARYGLRPRLPAPYSLDDVALPNRVALVGMQEGWGIAYVKEAYRRWFEHSDPADKDANLHASLTAVGADPGQALAKANTPAIAEELARVTQEAQEVGVFGAPTFVVDGEVFWGDDATDMFLDYLANPDLLKTEEMTRLSTMPMGLVRKR